MIDEEDVYISAPSEPEEWFMTIKLNCFDIKSAIEKKNKILSLLKIH